MFMTITSFPFLLFVAAGLIIYYIVPKSWQWVQLLIMSLVFYCCAAEPYTIVWLIISALTAYGSTMWMERLRQSGEKPVRAVGVLTALALGINILIWFVFKGSGFWAPLLGRLPGAGEIASPDAGLVAALGMGYYTLQTIGYVLDCAWEKIKPQKNPCKLFLFVCFFPQLVTGPISQYSQLESLYEKHNFQYSNVTHGAQRMLWGFFKKLVLAERAGIIVSGITADPAAYTGFYALIAILLYPVQMYADFSGCMDIVIGAAEMFDIRLVENFRNPFFARTSQEFWQRWHITLGVWAKEYVLYPMLKSKAMVRFGKFTRKKFGKKMGKFIATAAGMFALWMVMGIWHGAVRFIVGVSLWYWVILMAGELMSPAFQKMTEKLQFKTDSFSWHLFQSARTYVIYAVGATFFGVGLRRGARLLLEGIRALAGRTSNPWIFFDGSILSTGVSWADINIIIFAVLLLIIVGILREKYGYARVWMDRQGVVFRWGVWILLFLLVLIYGKYGPGYDAADFIYQGF